MIERLARALEHVGDLPENMQEELAEQMEHYWHEPSSGVFNAHKLAGVWSNLPDDMEETLLRSRRETLLTSPIYG
jgi:hypothetical protein